MTDAQNRLANPVIGRHGRVVLRPTLEAVKPLLGIPDEVDVLAVVPFGYPADDIGKGVKERKPLGEVVHRERLVAVAQSAEPAVLISGHLSNFEVMAAAIIQAGVRCHVSYRATNNPEFDKRIRRSRARFHSRASARPAQITACPRLGKLPVAEHGRGRPRSTR